MILIQAMVSKSVQTFSAAELFLIWLQWIMSLSTQQACILFSLWIQTRLWLSHSDIEKTAAITFVLFYLTYLTIISKWS